MSGPHGLAVRINARRLRTSRVHRIPRPTSVTIAIRPSFRARDAGKMLVICPTTKAKYFFGKGWTVFAKQLADKFVIPEAAQLLSGIHLSGRQVEERIPGSPSAQNSFAICRY